MTRLTLHQRFPNLHIIILGFAAAAVWYFSISRVCDTVERVNGCKCNQCECHKE